MQASGIPSKFPVPFASGANSNNVRSIPQTQPTQGNGQASFTLGFPPECFVNPTAGGIPQDGRDVNGILLASTSWSQWFQAGGPVVWDSSFSSTVGGYPNGAIVQSATTPGLFWLCQADNNTSNPDSGGANWIALNRTVSVFQQMAAGTVSALTIGAGVYWIEYDLFGAGGPGGVGSLGGSIPGSGGAGGAGARVRGRLAVSPGDKIGGQVGSGQPNGNGSTILTQNGNTIVTVGGGSAGGDAGGTSPGGGGNGGTISYASGYSGEQYPGANGGIGAYAFLNASNNPVCNTNGSQAFGGFAPVGGNNISSGPGQAGLNANGGTGGVGLTSGGSSGQPGGAGGAGIFILRGLR